MSLEMNLEEMGIRVKACSQPATAFAPKIEKL